MNSKRKTVDAVMAATIAVAVSLQSAVPVFAAGNTSVGRMPDALPPAVGVVAPVSLIAPTIAMPLPAISLSAPVEGPTSAQTPAAASEPTALSPIQQDVQQAQAAAGDVSRASPGEAAALGSDLQNIIGAGASAAAQRTPLQKERIQVLRFIGNLLKTKYAPLDLKGEKYGLNIDAEYKRLVDIVDQQPTLKDAPFQRLLAGLFAKPRDYHAGIGFYAKESAKLPFTTRGIAGRYYIADIDRALLPVETFAFETGDEILEFGGRPVKAAVDALKKETNKPDTDDLIASMQLTSRSRRIGMEVPNGPVTVKIRRADGTVGEANLTWKYHEETIPTDIPVREGLIEPDSGFPSDAPRPDTRGEIRALIKRMLNPFAHPDAAAMVESARKAPTNKMAIGSKVGYVGALGDLVWQPNAQQAEIMPFRAAIYKDKDGRRIGYVRIPDYGGSQQDLMIFANLIKFYNGKTDALVFDQTSNPGGSVFYMYALLSMLTDKPLKVPTHRLNIDASDAAFAADILEKAQEEGLEEMIAEEFEAESTGLMLAAPENHPLIDYANFVLAELKAGRLFTNPIHLFGLKEIEPAELRYDHPNNVFILTDRGDFSAADLLPAIAQDNNLGVVYGESTAGAGGAVKTINFPNQSGIEHVSYTWTLAIRVIGTLIEGLGVTPTPENTAALVPADLRPGGDAFVRGLLAAIARRVPPPPPAASGADRPVPDLPNRPRRRPPIGPVG